jgi:rRNA maturation endonuclease Nob1
LIFFHFFFIPLFRWNEKYYVKCNGCNSIYEFSKEKGKRLEKGEDLEVVYWDLKTIENEYGHQYNENINSIYKNSCEHCGKSLESKFEYCPYCGEKIN